MVTSSLVPPSPSSCSSRSIKLRRTSMSDEGNSAAGVMNASMKTRLSLSIALMILAVSGESL